MGIIDGKKKCPICGKEIDIFVTRCPYCHYSFSKKYDEWKPYVTSISGQVYDPSSGTTSVSPPFDELADIYSKDEEKEFGKKRKEDLLEKPSYLDEPYLISLSNWGYISQDDEGYYRLTDIGREAYQINREFKEKIKRNKKKTEKD